MKQEYESNDLTHANLMVRFTAVCRRFMSTTEVVHDTIGPWLRGGRAHDIIKSSDINGEAIGVIAVNLLKYLKVGQTLLQFESESLKKFDTLCSTAEQRCEDLSKSELCDTSQELLSLVRDGARETADLIRSFWDSPTTWCSSRALENNDERLDHVLRSLDYMRWQILKGFAKLLIIFDYQDDPHSDEPCAAWEKDKAGMGIA